MIIFGILNLFIVLLFCCCLNSYFIAKHIYVFRNSYFDEEFNEKSAIFWIRFINILLTFFMILFELPISDNIYQLQFFQVLNQGFYDENVNPGIVYTFFTTMVIFTIIGNHIFDTVFPWKASILGFNFIILRSQYSERVDLNQRIVVDPLRVQQSLYNKVEL